MQNYLEKKTEALRQIKIADHLMTMTYPIVQDPKLLKVILNNLYKALYNALESFHNFEKLSYTNNNFEILVDKCKHNFKKYNISPSYEDFLLEIHNLITKRQRSDVEFIRKEKFVFSSKDYNLHIVTKEEMKNYIVKGKLFLNQLLRVIK